jgi:hypothetical protein
MLNRSVAERAASEGISPSTLWRQITAQALMLAALASQRWHERIFLQVAGRRKPVVNPPHGVVPWRDFPLDYLNRWLRACVADEVMDNLLPNWREIEARRQHKRNLPDVDIDELSELSVTDLLDVESEVIGRITADEFLSRLNPEQAMFLRLSVEGLSGVEIAQRLGFSESWGRVTRHRLRAAFAKFA